MYMQSLSAPDYVRWGFVSVQTKSGERLSNQNLAITARAELPTVQTNRI